MKKYLAEMFGTMVLVLMGCGVAVSVGCDPVNNIASVVATSMAFGLSVVAMAYTIGGISGCHINPAITLGVLLSGRMDAKDAVMYMVFQVIGAFIGSALLLP
ncbi:MAG: aquaporin [Neisseriaceae bacterium]|nr:aquaporin [Neisseriaceae bacterium]